MIGNKDVSLRPAVWMVAVLILPVCGCGDGFSTRWPDGRQSARTVPPTPAAPPELAGGDPLPPPDTLAEVEAFLERLQHLRAATAPAVEAPPAGEIRPDPAAPSPATGPTQVTHAARANDGHRHATIADAPATSNTSASIEEPDAAAAPVSVPPVVRFVGVVSASPTTRDGGEVPASGANMAAAAVAEERSFTLEEYARALEDGRLGLTETENAWRRMLLGMVVGADGSPSTASTPMMNREVFDAFADLAGHLHRALTDPLGRWDDALAASAAMHHAVSAAADLRIPTLLLCREVRSFGNYEAMPADRFLAGQSNRTIVYCEVENFVSRLNDNGLYETTLATRVELFDAVSGASVWSQEQPAIVDACRRRRTDFFVAQRAVLPATLAEGRYVLKMTVEDTLAGRVSEQTLDLEIRSPASLAAGG